MNGAAKLIWVITLGAILVTVAACGSSSTATAPANTSVTLQGSMNSTASIPGQIRPLAIDYSLYALYCVTFSNPTHSGNGAFDNAGQFSVTVTDAAGLPVGCFITLAADNSVVTTLTFTISAAGGIGGGTSGSASFDGGSYNITISFDPVAKTASADVVAVASTSPPPPTFTIADLAGKWNMICHVANTNGPDLAKCISFLPATIFLDIITATTASGSVYAMGAWPDQATFEAAGSTEGIAVTLPPEITGAPTSLTTGTNPTANPILKFPGFTATNYNYDTRSIAAQDAWDALTAQGTSDYDWSTGGSVSGSCSTDLPVAAGPLPVDGSSHVLQSARYCLLEYLNNASELDRNALVGSKHFVPQLDGNNSWTSFGGNSSAAATTPIPFRGTQVGQTPDIRSRFALLGMEATGATGSAHEDWHDTWVEGGGATCVDTGSTNITFVVNSATSATGWFTTRSYRACTLSSVTTVQDDSTAAFRVDMSRGDAAIMVNSFSTTKRPLDGKWFNCHGTGVSSPDEAQAWMVAGPYLSYIGITMTSVNGACDGNPVSVQASNTGYGVFSNSADFVVASWVDGSGNLSVSGPARADAGGNLPATPTATQLTADVIQNGTPVTGAKIIVYFDDSVPTDLRIYRGREAGHSSVPGDDAVCTNGSGNEACLMNADYLIAAPQN